MAGSTIMTAKNSFLEGLIMDFAPDNTQANCMTSALNATLLTFNGNEMQLQNDMGNGRVETAYLPDGYVPVGTCEFGDIIYIVSYNPLIDKALIGCFPSPERNISSEELHVPNDSGISASDFLELNGDQPTGNLKASSVKKILFLNNLHPGDKFIIASSEISENSSNISAYGSTDYNINDFPKLVKIHVVSVDEAGKITYLDSDVKWYNDNNYYISPNVSEENSEKKIDIDLYRDLLNSGYSVFKSKTSGQLALLVELEKITGFGCTWECYKVKDEWVNNQQQVTYDVYVNLNWNTDHNDINPHGAIINGKWATSNPEVKGWEYNSETKQLIKNKNIFNIVRVNLESELSISRHYSPENVSSYTSYLNTCYDKKIESLQNVNKLTLVQNINGTPLLGKYVRNCYKIVSSKDKIIYLNEEDEAITTYISIDDTLVNNYFNYPVTKKLGSFTIPINTKVIAPENKSEDAKDIEYVRENDLSQLIYNYKIVPTMPYGKLDEFTVDGYIDFSKIGKLHIELHTWKYYNSGGNSTLTWGMDAYTDTGFVVKDVIFEFYNDLGLVATLSHPDYSSYNGQFTDIILLDKVNTFGKWTPGPNVQNNKLLSNSLYLVKIIVKQGVKTVGGEIVDRESGTEVIMCRWLWTNEMFNKHYYVKLDYDDLKVELNLDCDVKFSLDVNIWNCVTSNYSNNFMEGTSSDNIHKTFSANVQTVEPNKNNVNADINVKLLYDYGTFTLDTNNKFNIDIFEGYESLVNYPERPLLTYSGDTYNEHNYIYPLLAKPDTDNINQLEEVTIPTNKNVWDNNSNYTEFKSTANLKIEGSRNASGSDKNTDLYVSSNGRQVNLNSLNYLSRTNQNISTKLNLLFSTKHYSKYYYTTASESGDCITMRSCLYGSNDLNKYNLYQSGGKIFFNNYVFGQGLNEHDYGDDEVYANTGGFTRTSTSKTIQSSTVVSTKGTMIENTSDTTYLVKDVINRYKTDCADHWSKISFVFPFIFGWDESRILNDWAGAAGSTAKKCEFLAATYMVNKPDHAGYPSSCVKRSTAKENTVSDWRLSAKRSAANSEQYGEDLWNKVQNSNVIKKSFIVFKYPDNNFKVAVSEYEDDDFNINKVLSLLQQTYYLTGDSSKVINFYKDNFIYLDSNYTAYTRDVVFRILNISSNTLHLNNKGLIGKNSSFITNTINKSGIDTTKVKISENNYIADLKQCIKSYPVLFKIDYIKPYIEPKRFGSLIRIEGLSEEGGIKYIESLNIDSSVLYYFNDLNEFVPLTNTDKLRINNYTYFDLNNNKCTIDNSGAKYTNAYMNISKLTSQLSISNGALTVNKLPSYSQSKKVHVANKEGGEVYFQFESNDLLKTI